MLSQNEWGRSLTETKLVNNGLDGEHDLLDETQDSRQHINAVHIQEAGGGSSLGGQVKSVGDALQLGSERADSGVLLGGGGVLGEVGDGGVWCFVSIVFLHQSLSGID